MPSRFRLIAVFGTGRNGSTMFCRVLDGAPGLYVHIPESNFLSAFDDLARRDWVRQETVQNARATPLRRLDGAVPTERLLRFYANHWTEIRSAAIEQTDFAPAFFAAAERWLFGANRAEAVLFKSIETPYIAAYHGRFTDMRFIHLIRNPVATWASATDHDRAALVASRRGERAFIVARTYERARALGYFEGLPRPDAAPLRYAWLAPDRWDFCNAGGAAGWARAALWYLRRRWYVWRALGNSAAPARAPAGAADGGQAE